MAKSAMVLIVLEGGQGALVFIAVTAFFTVAAVFAVMARPARVS